MSHSKKKKVAHAGQPSGEVEETISVDEFNALLTANNDPDTDYLDAMQQRFESYRARKFPAPAGAAPASPDVASHAHPHNDGNASPLPPPPYAVDLAFDASDIEFVPIPGCEDYANTIVEDLAAMAKDGCTICGTGLYGGADPTMEGAHDDICKYQNQIGEAIADNFDTMRTKVLVAEAVSVRREKVEKAYEDRTGKQLSPWSEQALRLHLEGGGIGCLRNPFAVTDSCKRAWMGVLATLVSSGCAVRSSRDGKTRMEMAGVKMLQMATKELRDTVVVEHKLKADIRSVRKSFTANHVLPRAGSSVTDVSDPVEDAGGIKRKTSRSQRIVASTAMKTIV